MTRHRQHDQGTYDLLLEQQHLLRVPCPPPPLGCGAPIDHECVKPYRHAARSGIDVDRAACPRPPEGCGADHGEPCHIPHGTPRLGPGCWRRVAAADAAEPDGAHPALPEPPTASPPGRRLLPVEEVRRDVVEYRVPCGWCHAPVVWAVNRKGDETPVDAEPSDAGHLVLSVVPCGPRCRHALPLGAAHVEHCGPRCHELDQLQIPAARKHGQRLHTPHRKTCPQGGRPTWTRGVRHGRRR